MNVEVEESSYTGTLRLLPLDTKNQSFVKRISLTERTPTPIPPFSIMAKAEMPSSRSHPALGLADETNFKHGDSHFGLGEEIGARLGRPGTSAEYE